MSLADLGAAADLAQKIDPNPVGLFWRLFGFSDDERQAGVPPWSWGLVLVGTGIALGVKYGPDLVSRYEHARNFAARRPRKVE